jgi:Holliday junction DNA helicase RuvA
MIASLKGKLVHKDMDVVVLEVQGVGYALHTPLSTYYDLPDAGEDVCLRVHLVIRDNTIELFGFSTDAEKAAFLSLISVAGIGPRLARNILSGIQPDELADAVLQGDSARLRAIPGVGKRTAERVLVELKDKGLSFVSRGPRPAAARRPTGAGDGMQQDVLSALINLGYRESDAVKALRAAGESVQEPRTVQSWLRESLRHLAK